jgi:hypothetical protein
MACMPDPKLDDFAAPGFVAVRTFKAMGDETAEQVAQRKPAEPDSTDG